VFQLFGNDENRGFCERIYLQTDKNLYLAGESILMKIITTDYKHNPIIFSKVAYVEITDDSDTKIQIMVSLNNGIGTGRVLLPVDLQSGYYRIIAYTQYMRNEGTDVFFEKNIAVINTFQSGYYLQQENLHLAPSVLREERTGISLQSDKKKYSTRNCGKLIINDLPDNIHTLSVTIAGKDFVYFSESNNSLYHKNISKEPKNFIGNYIPEYEGHIVAGTIMNNETEKAGYRTSLIPVITFPGDEIKFFAGQRIKNEEFSFYTSGIKGTKEIAAAIYNSGGKYRLDIKSPFVSSFSHRQMPTLFIDSIYYNQLLSRSIALQTYRYFYEEESEIQNISESYFILKPSYSYRLDDYTRFSTMREVFIEFIEGARFRSRAGKQELSILSNRDGKFVYGTTPIVLLDGVPIISHDAIYNYNPHNVEKINIYYGPYVMGNTMFDGIIELITYRKLHEDLSLDKSTQIISYDGPQPFFRLITPDYSNEKNRLNRVPDGRHTLFWEPDFQTDGEKSIQLSFNTSDLKGEFQATVEAITKDGKFIFATAYFIVE